MDQYDEGRFECDFATVVSALLTVNFYDFLSPDNEDIVITRSRFCEADISNQTPQSL